MAIGHSAAGAVFQHARGDTQLRQVTGDLPGRPQPGGIVRVHQDFQLLHLVLIVLGQLNIADGIQKPHGVILIFLGQVRIVIGAAGGGNQGAGLGHAPIVVLIDLLPVNGIGQGLAEAVVVLEPVRVQGVAGQVNHDAVVHFPELKIAAVFAVGVQQRVGAGQVQVAELKLVPQLALAGGLDYIDLLCPGGQVCLAPPGFHLRQIRAVLPGVEFVGAGAQRMLRRHLRCLDNGNVQQQRQIFVGRIQVEGQALVLPELVLNNMGKPALVIVAFPGGIVGRDHIADGDPGAVGKPGVGVHIEGVNHVVRGYPVFGTQDGHRLILAVVGKQALIDQGEQHPVGKVHGDQGIHGPVGVISQNQCLILPGIRRLRGLLPLHQDGVAGGHIGFLFLLGAAGSKQAQDGTQAQGHCNDSFHAHTSLHTITAPWLPRWPWVTRWDQKRWL